MTTNEKEFIAHKTDEGQVQLVRDHLAGTAYLASCFAGVFGCETLAEQMGMGHDIGKYSKEFQRRILQEGPKVDHATAGGIEICKGNLLGPLLAYGMMGHHGGMPDGGSRADTAGDSTLIGRKKKIPGEHICDYRAFAGEIQLKQNLRAPAMLMGKQPDKFTLAFLTRMLFSCLVDADYLDTENFMSKEPVSRGGYESITSLLKKLEEYIKPWGNPQTELNKKRCEILSNCIAKARGKSGIYTLTVPTGGGKTVASLAFALNHAVNCDKPKERIIYAIPYTSIIEQNAEVFEKILGEQNVISHHSNVSYDSDQDDGESGSDLMKRKRLATENWDAPVIVTTNVQFLESLFSNKPGKCRKLHHIANSVIIFDEAQMLPLKYLKPCMRAITELVENYHCTVVLCTATQPALEKFISPKLKCSEISQNPEELFCFFKRTTVVDFGKLEDQKLVDRLIQHDQVLCIVNSRRQAQQLYEELGDEQNTFHLSTYMMPAHRRYILGIVRERLSAGQPCRLIATSLVEAGVDLDFSTVYRARAGLDSVIQAAGRCNREGKRPAQESFVYIFDAEKKYSQYYPPFIEIGRGLEREVANCHEDITMPEAIRHYFNLLHNISDDELDEKGILAMIEAANDMFIYPFKRIASEFRLIEQGTKMVIIAKVIPDSQRGNRPAEIVNRLRAGDISRGLLREAGLYAVNVYDRQFRLLIDSGQIELIDEEIAVLLDEAIYDERMGLRIVIEEGKGLFL